MLKTDQHLKPGKGGASRPRNPVELTPNHCTDGLAINSIVLSRSWVYRILPSDNKTPESQSTTAAGTKTSVSHHLCAIVLIADFLILSVSPYSCAVD